MQFHLRTLVDYVAIALAILAGLALIGAPVKVLLRWAGASVGRVVPAPVIGIALVVLGSWYWATPFGGTKPVARILLAIGVVVALGTAVYVLRGRRWMSIVRDTDMRAGVAVGAACFAGLVLILVVNDTQLFTRTHFTVLSLGNNDAASFGHIAQHMLDEGPSEPGNIANYDAGGRSLGFSGGACALLAGAASLTGLDVWRIQTPTLLVVLTLGAYTLTLLLREVLGRERAALALVASLLGHSVMYVVYLSSQWFFAQLVGMVLVLAVTTALFSGVRSDRRTDTVAAVGVCGLLLAAGLFVYPHMAVAGSVVLLPLVAVTHTSVRRMLGRGLHTGLAFGGSLLFAGVLAPGLVVDAVDITRELEGAAVGWPLPSIFPTEMLGFQSDVRAGQGWMTVAASAVVVGALVVLAGFAWRRGRGDAAAPLIAAIAVVLVSYALVYYREEGPTYRQWKWVTFLIPLFVASAVSIVGLAASACARRQQMLRRWMPLAAGLYGAVVLFFASAVAFPIRTPDDGYLSVTLDQINLQGDERLDDLPSIHINASPYWETMWLAYFLRDVPLTLGPPTYYAVAAPVGPWYLERIDQPVPEGAEITLLNDTYRLTRMPD